MQGCLTELDMSPLDKKEQQRVTDFVSTTCGCSVGPSEGAYSTQFSMEEISLFRNNCLEMNKRKLDLVLLAALSCSRAPSVHASSSLKVKTMYITNHHFFATHSLHEEEVLLHAC